MNLTSTVVLRLQYDYHQPLDVFPLILSFVFSLSLMHYPCSSVFLRAICRRTKNDPFSSVYHV